MAENNVGREERPETGSEEETSSRDYSTDSEGTVGEVQGTEEERIALAIEGKGEFLSEELKKLLREIEVMQGLRAGALGGDRSPTPRSHRAISGETERSAQRRNIQTGRKIPCPERKGQCWRKAGRSHHDGDRGRSQRDPVAGRGPRWGRTGRQRRHLRARCGQHVEGSASTRDKGSSILGE
jgi:hypothetical protein